VISNITLNAGTNGVNNNFGELTPATVAGFVYVDADNNGIKGTSEAGHRRRHRHPDRHQRPQPKAST